VFAFLTAPTPWAGDVTAQRRLNSISWWLGYLGCLVVSLGIAGIAWVTAPQRFSIALLVVLMTAVLCVARPVWGLYPVVLFALLGDAETAPSYPFVKNLSSRESILFLSDELTVSPFEILIAALVLGWVLNMLGTRQWTLYRGRLSRPMAVFIGFVFLGLVWGMARGGDPNVAIWELRPLLYLGVLYLLISNLFQRSEQYRALYWLVMIAITFNGILALRTYGMLSAAEKAGLESLGEHGAAVQANAMLVLIFATWLFHNRSWSARWLLPIMAVPVTWAYLIAERRAAMIALIAGFILLFVVLRWRSPHVFRVVAPIVLIVGTGYVGAFWSASGMVAFPAQAVKTVIAPEQQTEEDQASDLYRKIENLDIQATIKSNPALGVGFGQKFLMPHALPDISFFVFFEYITHNSILWIWMKAGIGGFLALLYLFSSAMRSGARALLRAHDGAHAAMTLTSVAFVAMFAVFAYVDIAFDVRNMVLLALALAQIDRAASRDKTPAPEPAPQLATGALVP
jgi:O-Antigen ligase